MRSGPADKHQEYFLFREFHQKFVCMVSKNKKEPNCVLGVINLILRERGFSLITPLECVPVVRGLDQDRYNLIYIALNVALLCGFSAFKFR